MELLIELLPSVTITLNPNLGFAPEKVNRIPVKYRGLNTASGSAYDYMQPDLAGFRMNYGMQVSSHAPLPAREHLRALGPHSCYR